MVNHGPDGRKAVTLWCRAWTCLMCAVKRRLQLIALARSGQATHMITLTVNPREGQTADQRARDLSSAWKTVTRLFKTKYKGKKLPYLCVFEATKKGEPHLHILVRMDWMSYHWLRAQMKRLIGAPVVHVQPLEDKKRAAYYVSKYVGKASHRFGSCKRYWCTPDWELTKYEKPVTPGRWPNPWTLEHRKLSELAADWRGEGLAVEETKNFAQSLWKGPGADELDAYEAIMKLRSLGLPW